MQSKYIVPIALTILLSAGLIIGLILVERSQDIRREAAVAEGQATIHLRPSDLELDIPDNIFVDMVLETNPGIEITEPISSIVAEFEYQYDNNMYSSPPLTVDEVYRTLHGNWTYLIPGYEVNSVEYSPGIVRVKVHLFNTSHQGFTLTDPLTIARLSLTAHNPGQIDFFQNNQQSFVITKNQDLDILQFNTTAYTYTIADPNPTPTPTHSPTPSPTLTPTPTATLTPSPSPYPEEMVLCEAAGGEWEGFTDLCADTCARYEDPDQQCLPVATYSCQCGANLCWTGEECRPIAVIDPTPTITPTPEPVSLIQVRLRAINNFSNPLPFDVYIRQGDQDIYSFNNIYGTSDQLGVYTVNLGEEIDPGTYTICVNTISTLQRCVSGIEISQTGSTSPESNYIADFSTEETMLLSGDVNNDNIIDGRDIVRILAYFTDFRVDVPPETPEDINNDGYITIDDFALALVNYLDTGDN